MDGNTRGPGKDGEVELNEAQLEQVVGGAPIGAASGKIQSTDSPRGTSRNAVADGTSNTIFFAETRGGS